MKKFTLIVFSLLLVSVTAVSAPISREEAKAKAALMVKSKWKTPTGKKLAARKAPTLIASDVERQGLYIFNLEGNNGYVIVSGDDSTNDILGYSETGSLNESNLPEALRYALDDYQTVVKFAREHNLTLGKRKAPADRKDVDHFVNFTWNQSGAYAANCPNKYPTGCMAVSTGMIVAYYKYPETLPAAYNSNVSEQASNADWNPDYTNMPVSVSSYSSNANVAQFLRHIADLLNTKYAEGGSGALATALVPALVKMGYDPAMKRIKRDAYSAEDWDEMIYNEVKAGRPVSMYGDNTDLGGHSYVCDGYQASTGFYYINWGWGGTCNGWFDMGILNPFVDYFSSWSGMGYTCPPAGFTSGLEAVIGIQPKPEGEVVATTELLTLEDMSLGYGNQATATIFNYNEQSYTGAVRWAILNDDGTFKLLDVDEKTLRNFTNYTYATLDLSKLNLEDGTYKISMVCKKSDAGEWNLCEGYKQKYVEVTVANGEKTIVAHPIKALEVLNVEYKGTTGNDSDQYLEYVVTLKNNGDDFYGNFSLSGTRNDNVKVSGSSMNIGIAGGKTISFSLFVSKGTGYSSYSNYTYDLVIKNGSTTIWTGTVTNSSNYSNYTSYDGVEFEDYEYDASGNAMLYSTALKGSVNIKNGSYYIFNGPIRITLKDADGNIVGQTTEKLVLQKNEVGKYPVNFTGLQSGKVYKMTVEAMKSTRSGSSYSYSVDKTYFSDFAITVKVGIAYTDENGKLDRMEISGESPVSFPATTTSIDLTKFSADLVNLESIENPNCVYYFTAGAEVPAELEGENVVMGDVAEQITLTDGNPVAFTKSFTATTISYKRTFTKGNNADGKNWNTIVLPFDAKVTEGGQTLDWFHSDADNGRKFWLYEYKKSRPGTVVYGYQDAELDHLKANVPYILSVPGDKWGDRYDLTGKEFTFQGENVVVEANNAADVTFGNYTFNGTYALAPFTNAYILNEGNGGDYFELTDRGTAQPFRAYFVTESTSTTAAKLLSVEFEGSTTGINRVNGAQPDGAVYNLQGMKVAHPAHGVYIKNGKKYVIK